MSFLSRAFRRPRRSDPNADGPAAPPDSGRPDAAAESLVGSDSGHPDAAATESPADQAPAVGLSDEQERLLHRLRTRVRPGRVLGPRARFAMRRRRTRRPLLPSAVRRALVAAISFTVLLGLTTAVLAAVAYKKYNGQIKRISVLQTNDPNIREATKQQNAVNFLIIGSDTRAGADAKYGNAEGARSDTNIIVHLSPDHQHVTVISIPRDSFVDIPACKKADGTTVPAHQELFNSAFSVGGPACTVATVQKLTGIEITHYLEVDFAGFANMVNAIGTVTICSPQVVYDPLSGLRLKKGNNALNGAEALQYVRARETLGNGSDLERIQRQQLFMGAVLRQAVSGRMLSNPVRLTQFLDAATKSITVDKGTSFADLRTLAESMQGLDPAHVVFYTAPIKNADYHPRGYDYYGKVLLDPVAGQALYDSVINDDVPVLVTTENGTPTVPASTAPASTAPASSSAPATTAARPSAAPLPKPNGTAADVTCKL
jgi:LCP family protein required for cell wall assembly